MRLALVFILSCLSAIAQQGGAGGRTTGASGSGSQSLTYNPGLGTINCSGTSCFAVSGTVSPGSQSVTGTLHFITTHDAGFTIGGASGGGAGLFQVSCDGGSTWLSPAGGSATIGGGAPAYNYPTPTCTGPTNLNTLLFRSLLGGGGPTTVNETFTAPSSVTVTW